MTAMTFEHPISVQLELFLRAVALGASLGLVYDIFRALRGLGGKLWGGALDVLFCLTSAASLFFFIMAGDGEMRIFVILGAGGGMLLFLCLAGPLLRPVWRFWISVFLSPVRLLKRIFEKGKRKFKKLFSFGRIRVIMIINHLHKRRGKGGEPDEPEA